MFLLYVNVILSVLYDLVMCGRVISTFGRARPRGPGSAAPPRPPGGRARGRAFVPVGL